MRRTLKSYFAAVADAERRFSTKLKTATAAAEARHDEKAIDDLAGLASNLLTPHVVAVWKRPRAKNVHFLSDETLMVPQAKNPEALGYWSISQEGAVSVALPIGDNAEKFSTAQGTLADDGKSLAIQFAGGRPQTWELVDE